MADTGWTGKVPQRIRASAAARIGVTLDFYDQMRAAGQKWCIRCKLWHSCRAFGADRSRSDGFSASCVASRRAKRVSPGASERRSWAKRGMSWCRDCCAWVPLAEVVGGRCRDHRNADYRARYARDGESIRQRVYARKRSLSPIPGWWIEDQRTLFGNLCAYGCGAAATTIDHVWPVSLGGQSRPANLAPACLSCNSRKNNRHPEPWVDRGLAAFPDQWADLFALAAEHGIVYWAEVA